jgi:hypothetical protein
MQGDAVKNTIPQVYRRHFSQRIRKSIATIAIATNSKDNTFREKKTR